MGKRVAVVGAGPGGLAAAMLLAHRGYDVVMYERHDEVGGRNRHLQVGDYRFDVGPTFLMLPQILAEIFAETGRDLADRVDLRRLDPMYRLSFHPDQHFHPTNDREAMLTEIERLFPGDGANYLEYLRREKRKFDALYPCLQMPYEKLTDFLRPNFIRAAPVLDATRSVYDRLARYFRHENLRVAMTFQAKYLGMSPWECPATFTILALIEHLWGVWHPVGGLNALSKAMAQAVREDGGTICLGTPVRQVLVQGGRAVGVELADGERQAADYVVTNADFAYAMTNLVDPEHRRRWTDSRLARCDYSCSTFMLYLALDRTYPDAPHHNIIVAQDYRANVDEVVSSRTLPRDPSIYVQNACVTDPGLAPAGGSTLYVLVPAPNLTGSVDWGQAAGEFRDRVVRTIMARTTMKDLADHIVAERVYTPDDWAGREHVYRGAVFNLAHSLRQMLLWRPHNRFEEFGRCYLVGGGTHPGSGLPTIYESGRIAAGLIEAEERGLPYRAVVAHGSAATSGGLFS